MSRFYAGNKLAYTDKFSLGSTAIEIAVGQGEETKAFVAHKNLLIHHSEFFKAALDGNWAESKDRKVTLPEEFPEYFAMFVQFLYNGQIHSARDGDSYTDANGKTKDREWGTLAKAWAMGQRLLSTTYCDAVVDALLAKINEGQYFPTGLYSVAYKVGRGDSAMRKLLVDVPVWRWPDDEFKSNPLEAGSEGFRRDLAIAFSGFMCSARQGVDPLKDPGCRYHEHVAEKDKPCYKTMF